MKRGWLFEKMGDMGGAHHGTYLSPLNASGLPQEHLLAREAIQNSVDAHDGVSRAVKVRFSQRRLDDASMSNLTKTLELLDQDSPVERYVDGIELGIGKGDFFAAVVDENADPQDSLTIEDYGTVGLGGPQDSTSLPDRTFRYYRLVLGFGIEDTSDLPSGGSYGFGKSVYPRASNVSTVIYYSVFRPGPETQGAHARFIVGSIFHTHWARRKQFSGRAWFGNLVSDRLCEPLIDEEAHEMARAIGLEPRSSEEVGTTITALGSSINMDVLEDAIAENWWPRIVDGELICELENESGESCVIDPKRHDEVEPFIKAYRIARQVKKPEPDIEFFKKFNRDKGIDMGTCGIVAMSRIGSQTSDAIPNNFRPKENTVALIRSPRMVVRYADVGGGNDVVGAYLASDELDPILKRSEPANHAQWSPSSSRLETDDEKRRIRGIPNRIRHAVNEFRNQLAGPRKDDVHRPRELERMLGNLLRTPGAGGRGNPRPPRPFRIIQEREGLRESLRNGKAIIRGKAEVLISTGYEEESLDGTIEVEARIVADDNRQLEGGTEGKLKAWFTRVSHPKFDAKNRLSQVPFSLRRNQMITCSYETEPFDDYCLVRVMVSARQENDR
jgi:hypothetical protein